MFRNVAYLGQIHEDIVDYSKPLIVTAAGNRRALTINLTPTRRPNGRSDYQLIYVASGKVVFSFNGKTQLVRKGHAVLFRPGDPQYYSLCKNNKPEIFWVHFTGSGVEEILDHYQIPKDENVFFVGTRTDYQWFFNRMITELQLKRVGFGDALTLNLQHIFLTINRYMRENNKIGTEMLNIIDNATKYFYENYNKNIVIEDYAKEHNITSNWFTQSFKKITKCTPMQYIISLRITTAMDMLDHTDYSISQIASAVGYDNSMYFSRIFKKHTGMSPSDYKKNIH
jgi:AraC-like DNA-binding protein